MFNSFNFINKSQKEFFKHYGYIVLQNQLTYKIKKNLKSYVQEIELDSLKKKPKFIHKFEYDSYNQKKLCRTEDLIKHSKINKSLDLSSFGSLSFTLMSFCKSVVFRYIFLYTTGVVLKSLC